MCAKLDGIGWVVSRGDIKGMSQDVVKCIKIENRCNSKHSNTEK